MDTGSLENFINDSGVERTTKRALVLYVTPISKIETEELNATSMRKSRRSAFQNILTPPSTSYGVPLVPQALPATSLLTSFQSNSPEEEQTSPTASTQSHGPQYYLPPQEKSNEEETIVTRNVYFYKAPTDFEPPARKPIKLPKPQKNYKVIFIKAPSVPDVPPIVQIVPQNEEKTLVYVLVKKPEEQTDIVIPSPAPTKASKPEVYFVNYQTQKEHIVNSEKAYGISHYGNSYYYKPETIKSTFSEDNSDGKSSDKDEVKDEDSTDDEKIEKHHGKRELLYKKKSPLRGTRSSSLNYKITQTNLVDFTEYFAPLKQRSKVYDK